MPRATLADDRQPDPRAERRRTTFDADIDDEERRGFEETLPADAKGRDAALATDDAESAGSDASTTGRSFGRPRPHGGFVVCARRSKRDSSASAVASEPPISHGKRPGAFRASSGNRRAASASRAFDARDPARSSARARSRSRAWYRA